MTIVKKALNIGLYNYRHARMQYELGSDDFRFTIDLVAVISVAVITGLLGLYTGGL